MSRLCLRASASLVFLLAFALLATSAFASTAGAPQSATGGGAAMVRIPGHVLPALAKATVIRLKTPSSMLSREANQPLTLTLVLKRDDEAGFERYLKDIYDPRSKNFRRFLTQGEIAARFGPSQMAYDDVLAYLQRKGFKLIDGSANHLTITVGGTRAIAERAFDIRIGDYRVGRRNFFGNDRDPAISHALAMHVAAVSGLTNFAQVSRVGQPDPLKGKPPFQICEAAQGVFVSNSNFFSGVATLTGLGGALRNVLFRIQPWVFAYVAAAGLGLCSPYWAYGAGYNIGCDVRVLLGLPPCGGGGGAGATTGAALAALPGAGQAIGLLEFDTFQPSDVSSYVNQFNSGGVLLGLPALDATKVSSVHVNGGAAATPGVGESEVLIDIDLAITVAPGAKVVVYDAPFNGAGSFQPVLNKMISDGVSIISNSWAYCEDQTTLADVQSIDTILQSAAAAGISVFSGTGDNGSTCLDGSPNTLAVPADSPNSIAVGGSSLIVGDGLTYQSETYWNGVNATPQTGAGGFGVSKFFSRPAYQNGLNAATMRSVPDVVAMADPANGMWICQTTQGGCPDGLLWGGTSAAAPFWAALAALLNQQAGKQFGFLNPLIYPLAGTVAFHNAALLGSDFSHVGLGSPNVDELLLKLTGQKVGPPSAGISLVTSFVSFGSFLPSELGVSADGASQGAVVVRLLDSNGHAVSGKTITVAANAGSGAQISPPSAVSSANEGAVAFAVTDLTPETVTFTAMDTTDGITLMQQPTLPFEVPPAAAAGIGASPGSVAADGTSTTTITVTLKDSLNRSTPGKLVTIDEGTGRSVINGPNPSVTDSSGQIQFTATNVNTESVTYTATDVTDGSLLVPGSAMVSFTSGAGTGCAASNLTATGVGGFTYTDYVTGFPVTSENCLNPSGMAFDALGDLYVADYAGGSAQGGIYKFPPSGGAAGPAFRLNASPYAAFTCASGLAFSKDGKHLYLARQGCNSGGDVVEVSTTDGHVIRSLTGAGLACASGLATDPLSGDLFVTQPCPRGTSNITRISNPDSGSPTVSVYSTPGGAGALVFSPDGTLWTEAFNFGQGIRHITKIAGTNAGTPGAFTYLTNAFNQSFGVLPALNPSDPGNPPFLLAVNGSASPGSMGDISLVDLTQNPPAQADIFTGGSVVAYIIAGPDGCAYATETDRIIRITKSDGSCPFAPSTPLPGLSLSPVVVMPNRLQGETQTLTATLINVTSSAGKPVFFSVTGSNPTNGSVEADANGQASFTYTGVNTSTIQSGPDKIIALATVNGATLHSNQAQVTWETGRDVTFLSLNPSQKSGAPGNAVTLTASLTDISQHPAVPVVGQMVKLALGGQNCMQSTDVKGLASCQVTPKVIPGSPNRPITASFAGTNSLVASRASAGFMFTAPPESVGLKVTPKTRSFPAETELGGVGVVSKPAVVTVFNPKSKKQNMTVTFLGADNTGDFTIVPSPPTTCDATIAAKAKCTIGITFSPTGAGTRTGTLMVEDNADLNAAQKVGLKGTGKQGALKFSPGSLNFGAQAKNTTSGEKTVKLANANPVPMAFAASITGDYAISSNTCASPLPPNSACAIGVKFTPTMTGSLPGTLTFTDTAIKSPQAVKLSGTGQ